MRAQRIACLLHPCSLLLYSLFNIIVLTYLVILFHYVCVAVFAAHQDVRRLVHESPSYISHLLNCVHTGSYYVYCISLWLQCRDSVQFFRNKKNASSTIHHMTNLNH